MSDATLSSPGLNRSSRPVWQSGVLESLVMLGMALAVDQVFFKGDRFWTVQPHPFWVPVLLVAVQHGTNAGLLAAGAATAALLIGNLPPQGINQDYYAYLFEITWQPLLWLAAALILGELRTRQVQDRQAWRDTAERLTGENAIISAAYEQLKDVKEQLEGRLASQQSTTAAIVMALRELEQARGEEVLVPASYLLTSALNASHITVYSLREDVLHLVHDDDRSASGAAPQLPAPDPTLLQAVAGQRRVISLLRPEEAALLGNAGMMAGPLSDGGRPVVGLVVVREMDIVHLSEVVVQLFALLLHWIGPAFARECSLAEPSSGEAEVRPGPDPDAQARIEAGQSSLT
jgi:hypothetical protein